MSLDENWLPTEYWFTSHELKSSQSNWFSRHSVNTSSGNKFKPFYLILILILGMVVAFSWYVIKNNLAKNPYQQDQKQEEKQNIVPTLGQILWWSWWRDEDSQSWSNIWSTWDVLVYTWSTWDIDILSWLDRPYLEQLKTFLNILDTDPNLKWYFDSDNISLSGKNIIKVQPVSDLPSTTLKLYGTTYPSIKNLYIIWVDDVVYYFNTIKHDNGVRSLELDGTKWSLKPWQNTYYIVWTDGVTYYINYIDYKTYDTQEFYQKLGRICVLDVCTDPTIKLVYNDTDGSYLQQNWDTVVKVIPGQEITVATRCDWSSSYVTYIKKIWDIYKKTTKGCNYITDGDVKQEFVNYLWETVINHELMKLYPTSLKWWNLTYIADFAINSDIVDLQKIEYLDYYDISAVSIAKWYLVSQVSFELPGNVFINYKLSNTPIMSLGYTQLLPGSNIWSAYKIAPKSFDWTTRSIIYTIPWSDPDMASILNQKLLLNNPGRVVISPNCGQISSSTDSNARFGIYPIDDKYDVIWFLNCNMIIRN